MLRAPRVNPRRGLVITGLGLGQILSWGSTFYLLAVMAEPIAADTGWSLTGVVAGVSVGLIVAGFGSPLVGTLVARNQGRLVLVLSALLLAVGLLLLGVSPNQWWYLSSWIVLGLGMSGGLYQGAFAVLGHTYGASARSAITMLTLFGGFASSICWPLSSYLVHVVGWRWTVVVYAGAHLLLTAPLYALTIPAHPQNALAVPATNKPHVISQGSSAPRWLLIVLVASVTTLGTSIAALMSMHMFSLLAGVGIAGVAAVAMAATIGPSQVGARLVELIIGRKHHPLWTMLTATFAMAVALSFLGFGIWAPALLVVVYGMGIGLSSIANGTVPLALFGQEHYARIMGRIALPSLLAQAAAPLVGSTLIQHIGPGSTLIALGLCALVAVGCSLCLMFVHFSNQEAAPGDPAPNPADITASPS